MVSCCRNRPDVLTSSTTWCSDVGAVIRARDFHLNGFTDTWLSATTSRQRQRQCRWRHLVALFPCRQRQQSASLSLTLVERTQVEDPGLRHLHHRGLSIAKSLSLSTSHQSHLANRIELVICTLILFVCLAANKLDEMVRARSGKQCILGLLFLQVYMNTSTLYSSTKSRYISQETGMKLWICSLRPKRGATKAPEIRIKPYQSMNMASTSSYLFQRLW